MLPYCTKTFDQAFMMGNSGISKEFTFLKSCFNEDFVSDEEPPNNNKIQSNINITTIKITDNKRLFIGNIPKTYQVEDVHQAMSEISEGVVKIILYPSVNDRTKNRGYGFVEYRSHQEAMNTRNKFQTANLIWSGQEVKIDWAEPEIQIDEQTMKKVRILYVRNLALCTTDQQLRDLFSKFGTLERVKKIKDYAFLHFSLREHAEEAKSKLQGYILDDCEIDISWSKPVTNRDEYIQRKAASRALTSGVVSPNGTLIQTAVGLNGEPLIFNQKVRTAAGAQGYITPRPYPLRSSKQHEESYAIPVPSPLVYPTIPHVHDPAIMRSPIEQMNIFPQSFLAPEKPSPTEEYIQAPQQDIHYHLVQGPNAMQARYLQPLISPTPYTTMVPTVPAGWGTQPHHHYLTTANHTATAFIPSPYFVPAPPTYSPITGAVGNATFFGNQVMANFSGPSMGIEGSS